MVKRSTPVGYMDSLDAAPADGVWNPGPYHRRARFLRRMIYVVVFGLVPLLILANLVSLTRVRPDTTASSAKTSVGYSVASDAVVRWLASDPAPLPGGRLLGWIGQQDIPVVPAPDGQQAAAIKYTTTVHTFSVVDGAGTFYTVSVQIGVDPRGGSAVIAGPSLIPEATPISDGWANSPSPWPGIASVSPETEAITAAVTGWAQAYTTGSPASLRLAVGDPSGANTYLPLAGVMHVETNVVAVGALPTGKSSAVVRVQLRLTWAGQPLPTSGGAKTVQPMVLDLLVDRADTAAPIVTAWGPPGTGPTLTRYSNAVSGQRSTAAPAQATPTSTATTSAG